MTGRDVNASSGNAPHEVSRRAARAALDAAMNRTLLEIDVTGVLDRPGFNKGAPGAIVEQSVFGYPADSARRPDLSVDGVPTELKTTGLVRKSLRGGAVVLDAKEPVSITAVQPETIVHEEFEESAFLEKCEHLLFVYYEYLHKCTCTADYGDFPLKAYDFHDLSPTESEILRRDWERVRDFIRDSQAAGLTPVEAYPLLSSSLNRHELSAIDTSPKWPARPRFRLKRAFVSSWVRALFGDRLEIVPEPVDGLAELDARCRELRRKYGGKKICELMTAFGLDSAPMTKAITERLCVRMFGGKSGKIGKIECIERLSVSLHTVVLTASGGRTEDFKVNQGIDFDEVCDPHASFEESGFLASFADAQLLIMLFRETTPGSLADSEFLGFKRLVIPDEMIEGAVRSCWERMRQLVFTGGLRDVVEVDANGVPRTNRKTGTVRSAPNWPKASEGDVFLRGSGRDARDKTTVVNGIAMYRQNPWIRGVRMVEEIERADLL